MFRGFSFLDWSLLLAMVITAVILFTGLVFMGKGGDLNKRYGNRVMRWRVIMQAIALGLFALILLSRHS